LSHWNVFDEFDHTTYTPLGPYAIQIVHDRPTTASYHLPLHFLKKSMIHNILSFLDPEDLSCMSITSSVWYKLAGSNKLWQLQYCRLKRQFGVFSHQRKELIDPLHCGVGAPSWPLFTPQRDYYKVVCAILMYLAKNLKTKRTLRRAVSWTSETRLPVAAERRSGSLNETITPQLPYLRVHRILSKKGHTSRRLTCAAVGAKYGLQEVDLDRPWFLKQGPSHQRKQKGRRLYNEAEIQLLAILKWGSLSAIPRRRGTGSDDKLT